MAFDSEKWKWWYFLLAGVGIIGLAIWEYCDLVKLENGGGDHWMSNKLAFIYDHFGKGGVLAVGVLIGGLLIAYSFWERTNIRRDALEEQRKKSTTNR